jgi:DNA-binding MarR family transcriptional regulator
MTTSAASAEPYESLRLDRQLCFGLYAAANAIIRAYRPLLAELGVTYPQYLVLMALWEHDRQTVSDLGRVLMLDSGTLTPLLKRMEASGLVDRRRRERDEREVEIALTERGRELREASLDIRRAIVCTLGMSETAILRLRDELNDVIRALTTSPRARDVEVQTADPV